jgi:signal transduction histidine kinase
MRRTLKIVTRKSTGVSHVVHATGSEGPGEPRVKAWKREEEHAEAGTLASQSGVHKEKRELILNTINELVLTISHYLNTPLTVLLGKVELLSEATENGGMSKEDMKKSLYTCKREIFKIDAIVKSFQNLCRLQHKSYPPGVKMLDVEEEIKNKVKEISFLR